MSRVSSSKSGYTIVEAIIFLAVSGLMFTMAALLIGGQQSKAAFQQGVRDIESQIQDIANDVSTGFYATDSSFSCDASPTTRATITNSAQERGTNKGCIYLGRAIQFSPSDASNKNSIYIYPVTGNKQVQDSDGLIRESQNLTDARPIALAPGNQPYNSSIPAKILIKGIPGGMTVEWIKYVDNDGLTIEAGGVGIFTTFGSIGAGGALTNGAISANILPIGDWNSDTKTFVDKIDLLPTGTTINPSSGVAICLQGGGTNQHVVLILGGSGRNFGTKTEFKSDDCESDTWPS